MFLGAETLDFCNIENIPRVSILRYYASTVCSVQVSFLVFLTSRVKHLQLPVLLFWERVTRIYLIPTSIFVSIIFYHVLSMVLWARLPVSPCRKSLVAARTELYTVPYSGNLPVVIFQTKEDDKVCRCK